MSLLNYDNLTDAEINALAEQLAAQANGTATTVNEDGEYLLTVVRVLSIGAA